MSRLTQRSGAAAAMLALVPPAFAAYCQLDLPDHAPGAQVRHDSALVSILSGASATRDWWLGYLEYGIGIDLPFDDAPGTNLDQRHRVAERLREDIHRIAAHLLLDEGQRFIGYLFSR